MNIELIASKNTAWEQEPLKKLVKNKNLACFQHVGFWHAMDSLRDKQNLEKIWESKNCPWRK